MYDVPKERQYKVLKEGGKKFIAEKTFSPKIIKKPLFLVFFGRKIVKTKKKHSKTAGYVLPEIYLFWEDLSIRIY